MVDENSLPLDNDHMIITESKTHAICPIHGDLGPVRGGKQAEIVQFTLRDDELTGFCLRCWKDFLLKNIQPCKLEEVK